MTSVYSTDAKMHAKFLVYFFLFVTRHVVIMVQDLAVSKTLAKFLSGDYGNFCILVVFFSAALHPHVATHGPF